MDTVWLIEIIDSAAAEALTPGRPFERTANVARIPCDRSQRLFGCSEVYARRYATGPSNNVRAFEVELVKGRIPVPAEAARQ